MEVLLGIAIALGGLALMVFLRSFTTLVHELGHAIPALWFTQAPVEVYVGSYGSLDNSLSFSLGRLRFILRWNPFQWQLGMCRHQGDMPIWQHLIVLMGGPLASILLAGLGLVLIVFLSLSTTWLYIVALFAGGAVIDLVVNLSIYDRAILMHDGQRVYSDGYQIRDLLRVIGLPEQYWEAKAALERGELEQCKSLCVGLLEDGYHQKKVYECYQEALLEEQDYEQFLLVYQEYKTHHRLLPWDFFRIADAYEQLGQLGQALRYFDHYLYLQFADSVARYRVGRIHSKQGDYTMALDNLNLALEIDPYHFPSLVLRAYCYLRQGQIEKAGLELERAQLSEEAAQSAELAYYQGLYFEKINRREDALNAFLQAQELGHEHHGLAMKIDELERSLQ